MPQGTSFTLTSAKLETGAISTLENSAPQNNDVEILKCLRYYYQTTSERTTPYSMIATKTNALNGSIVFAVSMRIKPTLINLKLRSNTTGTVVNVTSFDIQGDTNGVNAIYNIVADSELVADQWYTIVFVADAEIYD